MLHRQIDQYRLVRVLGEGGMGVVYEGVRDDIGARAAVKVLRPEFARNADVAARFFNEARAANLVDHPGIVRIFDYGQLPSGEGYLAMEFLEGELLRTRLDREKRLSEPEALNLGRQIASALSAAHSKQIIHRDMKPENVMLVSDAETPGGVRAKILDFGIAKLNASVSGFHTRTNTVMGTPAYMAPEQCRGIKAIDDRVDVYALGVMLFEMLSGRAPFIAEAPGDLIAMHMFQTPPLLELHLPGCDRSISRMLTSMLAKDPSTRPSMATVVQTLKTLGQLVSDVASGRLAVSQEQTVTSPSAPHIPMPQAMRAAAPAVLPVPTPVDLEATVKTSGSQPVTPGPAAAQKQAAANILAGMAKALKPSSLAPARKRERERAEIETVRAMPASAQRDDSTEVMSEQHLAALHGNPAQDAWPGSDETVPYKRTADVDGEVAGYLRERKRSQPVPLPSLQDVAIGQPDIAGPSDPTRHDSQSHFPSASWLVASRKQGMAIFISLSVIAIIFSIMILSNC